MKLVSKVAAISGALLFSASAFAAQHQEFECPKLAKIKAEGVENVLMVDEPDQYAVSHLSHYGFEESVWVFIVGPITADSENQALHDGQKVLNTMSLEAQPVDMDGEMACLYETGNPEVVGLAIDLNNTPDARTAAKGLRRFTR